MVLDNPAPFGNPLQFEITFECLQPLEEDSKHTITMYLIRDSGDPNTSFKGLVSVVFHGNYNNRRAARPHPDGFIES
jgi:hypothetical protein